MATTDSAPFGESKLSTRRFSASRNFVSYISVFTDLILIATSSSMSAMEKPWKPWHFLLLSRDVFSGENHITLVDES